MADQLLAEGRQDEAIIQLRLANSIAQERLPRSTTEGITAAKLASALMDSGAYEEALSYFEQAIRVLNAILPHDDRNLALLIGQHVQCLLSASRKDQAYQVLRDLFARARTQHFRLPVGIVAWAHDYANALADEGDYLGGAMIYEDVIVAMESMAQWGSSRHRSMAIDSLALLFFKADLPDQELAALRRLLAVGFASTEERCDFLIRATSAALRAGRADDGHGYLDESWSCLDSSSADHIAWSSFQFSRLGRPGIAHRVVDRALADEKLPLEARAKLLHTAAVAYLVEQDPCEAAKLGRQGIALLKRQKGAQAAIDARKLLQQSTKMCASFEQKAPKAITGPSLDPHYVDTLKEELARAQVTYAAGSNSVLGRRFNLASELAKLGRDDEACKEFGVIARVFTDTWLATAAELSRASQLSQQRSLAAQTINGLGSTCLPGTTAGIEPLLFLKGHVLEGVRQEATLLRLSEGKEREAALRLRSMRARIASTLLASGDSGLQEAIGAKERLERELTRPGQGMWTLEPLGIIAGVAGLRRSLLADEAYIDLTIYESEYAGPRQRKVLAIVLTRDAALRVDLGSEKRIRQARKRWLASIADWSASGHKQLSQLKALLLDPILASLPAGIAHLVISTDSGLDGVPWQHPDLTGGRTVWLVGSARDLVRYKIADGSPQLGETARMTIVRDASFNTGSGTLVEPAARLDFLRTPDQVRQRAGIDASPGVTIEDLYEKAASPAAFLEKLAQTQIVHVETHGVVLETRESQGLKRTPFSTAALALAGANRQDASGRRLGLISAEELLGVTGPELRVATLAICDSARGASIPGQGNLGLATALGSAGTPIVVASAWRSSLESAVVLFPKFYERLFATKDARSAFEEAIAGVRSSTALRGARHWAGWLYLGYGRESSSPTLALSRLAHRLCSCRSEQCGWQDTAAMDELKKILSTPNLSDEDKEVIVNVLVGLKQCAPQAMQEKSLDSVKH